MKQQQRESSSLHNMQKADTPASNETGQQVNSMTALTCDPADHHKQPQSGAANL